MFGTSDTPGGQHLTRDDYDFLGWVLCETILAYFG